MTREQVLLFRAAQSHLTRRLPAGSFREAAWGGLQDSSPRAALVSLHARVEGVGPGSWEDPSLWQIWLRMSDYLVPREDFGVFTLGALPRGERAAAGLIAVGDAVAQIVGERSRPSREVAAALAKRPEVDERTRQHSRWVMQEACVSGRYRMRWDTRSVTIVATPVPDIDPEEARPELARRFLHWHGPAAPRQFASWAHLPLRDAVETWRLLTPELLGVTVDGELRHVLSRDEDRLRKVAPGRGVRLIPLSDPVFAVDRKSLLADPAGAGASTGDERGASLPARVRNSLTGRILVDGAVAGSWGRRERRLSVWLWGRPAAEVRDRVLAEAGSLAGPLGGPVEIRRLS